MKITITTEHLDKALAAMEERERIDKEVEQGIRPITRYPLRHTQCCLLAQAVGGPGVVDGSTSAVYSTTDGRVFAITSRPHDLYRAMNIFDGLQNRSGGIKQEDVEKIRAMLPMEIEVEEQS